MGSAPGSIRWLPMVSLAKTKGLVRLFEATAHDIPVENHGREAPPKGR